MQKGRKQFPSETAVAKHIYYLAHPHLYCPVKRCLWHTGGGRCPRHEDELDEAREVIRDLEQERD